MWIHLIKETNKRNPISESCLPLLCPHRTSLYCGGGEAKGGSGESFHALPNPSHQINSSLDNDPPHQIKDFSESFYTRILQVLLLLLLLWRSGDWWCWVLAMTKTRTRSVFLGVSRIWICISSGTKCSRSDVSQWLSESADWILYLTLFGKYRIYTIYCDFKVIPWYFIQYFWSNSPVTLVATKYNWPFDVRVMFCTVRPD